MTISGCPGACASRCRSWPVLRGGGFTGSSLCSGRRRAAGRGCDACRCSRKCSPCCPDRSFRYCGSGGRVRAVRQLWAPGQVPVAAGAAACWAPPSSAAAGCGAGAALRFPPDRSILPTNFGPLRISSLALITPLLMTTSSSNSLVACTAAKPSCRAAMRSSGFREIRSRTSTRVRCLRLRFAAELLRQDRIRHPRSTSVLGDTSLCGPLSSQGNP